MLQHFIQIHITVSESPSPLCSIFSSNGSLSAALLFYFRKSFFYKGLGSRLWCSIWTFSNIFYISLPHFYSRTRLQQWSHECMGHSLAMWSKHRGCPCQKELGNFACIPDFLTAVFLVKRNGMYRNRTRSERAHV